MDFTLSIHHYCREKEIGLKRREVRLKVVAVYPRRHARRTSNKQVGRDTNRLFFLRRLVIHVATTQQFSHWKFNCSQMRCECSDKAAGSHGLKRTT